MSQNAPHNSQAEWNVIGAMLTKPEVIGEVVGSQVEPTDFFRLDTRVIFEGAVEAFFESDNARQVDAVAVAERRRLQLARAWDCDENEVTSKLTSFTQGYAFGSDKVQQHVGVIRKHGDNRKLLSLAQSTIRAIHDGEKTPEEIGDMLSSEASAVTTGRLSRGEVLPWMQVGGEYVRYLRRLKKARESGVELAAYFGLPFVDWFSKGLAPTELMMVAGEPGVGKSMVTWKMAENFARRQLRKKDNRIGTLVLSLEMGLIPSSARLATSMTKVDSAKLREGDLSDQELQKIAREWSADEDLPIYFNFASNFRLSQMRALIVEAIRRHNVGLIVLDHFRMVDPDRRINNANQEDEAKARFLKEDICKELNVAVICLAHTVKIRREFSDGRPTLADLRGSYQVAAHCDMVGFIYRPIMYATENEITEQVVAETEAEMIWGKNRNGQLGAMPFYLEPATMEVRAN